MKLHSSFKDIINSFKSLTILDWICYAFLTLFVYTALAKWMIYPIFLYDLGRAPLTSHYAGIISIVLPLTELIVAALLVFEKTRKWGLYGAFLLMVLFTGYVGYVLGMTTQRPCTCGGIFRSMSWPNHMIFNSSATLVALWGIWLGRKQAHRKVAIKSGSSHAINHDVDLKLS